jgi:hypothetical protein
LVRLVTTIPEEVKKEFRRIISEIDGGFSKYSLKKHTTRAIKQYLERIKLEKQQQQHTTYQINSISKDEEMISNLTELMKEIKTSLYWDDKSPIDISCGNTCHKKVLKNAIGKIQGQDYRTKNKWFDRFIEFKFIIKMPNSKEVFRILNDGHNYLEEPKEDIQPKESESKIMEGTI